MTKEGKQRLIPWLKARVSSGDITGLSWLDPEKTMFRIPWKHGGKQNFDTEDDSRIFREWAIQSGKFRPASDKPDPTKWKQNLRCAFNKSKEIEEVKERHHLEGTDPYKVYRIKKKATMSIMTKPEFEQPAISEADSTSPVACRDESSNGAVLGAQNIPSFDQLMLASGPQSGPDSFSDPAVLEQKITSTDLIKGYTQPISINSVTSFSDVLQGDCTIDTEFTHPEYGRIQEDLQIAPEAPVDVACGTVLPPLHKKGNVDVLPPSPGQVGRIMPEISRPTANLFNPHPSMLLRVQYLGEVMFKQQLDHPLGCKVRFSKATRLTIQLQENEPKLFGNHDIPAIDLPPFSLPPGRRFGKDNKHAQKKKDQGDEILKALYRGVDIFTIEGDIYIKRHCKCNIMYEKEGNLIKVDRYKETSTQPYGLKIFDFQRDYKARLDEYVNRRGSGVSPPSPFVHLVCAQMKRSEDALVCISIASKLAFDMLFQIDPSVTEDNFTLDYQSALYISDTNAFDEQAEVYRDVEEQLAPSVAQWTVQQADATVSGNFDMPTEAMETEEAAMDIN